MSLEFKGWSVSVKVNGTEISAFSEAPDFRVALIKALNTKDFDDAVNNERSIYFTENIEVSAIAEIGMPSGYSSKQQSNLSAEEKAALYDIQLQELIALKQKLHRLEDTLRENREVFSSYALRHHVKREEDDAKRNEGHAARIGIALNEG